MSYEEDSSMETYFILANHAHNGDILSYAVYPYEEESMAWYDLAEANYALPAGYDQEARLYSVQLDPNLTEEEKEAAFEEFKNDGIEESGGIRLDIS